MNVDDTEENEENEDEMKNFHTNEVKRAIIKFFVKDRIPLAKMESVHFNNLINGSFSIIAHAYVQLKII